MKYVAINCRFIGPVASWPELPWLPFWAALVGGSSLCQPPSEVDRTTWYWVKAYFSCKHYVPVWLWPLTYFLQNWVTWRWWWTYLPIWKLIDVFVF